MFQYIKKYFSCPSPDIFPYPILYVTEFGESHMPHTTPEELETPNDLDAMARIACGNLGYALQLFQREGYAKNFSALQIANIIITNIDNIEDLIDKQIGKKEHSSFLEKRKLVYEYILENFLIKTDRFKTLSALMGDRYVHEDYIKKLQNPARKEWVGVYLVFEKEVFPILKAEKQKAAEQPESTSESSYKPKSRL